ncbi:hypothetical protein CAPTEDRAFT_218874 [Capitella teleta]|uniref:Disks large-associated protein 1 n=1 Tax=Capitella teleta TaxID=283909 RepID=R7TAU4_CAPTE|nr:hypothetical protein CAPTEDRAFT_218874 [Capitella teleta]|eukprot:ELT90804.1 hypothetical protein CAPTEDRAFT_218874 [Capitella teleta]
MVIMADPVAIVTEDATSGYVRKMVSRFSESLQSEILNNGSEPSLVNHAPSSTPASKRTLTSHDPQPANGSVDNLDHSVDSEAKSPSYVKLSCAVSGYSSNKYNAFNSEDKVKKTKPPLPHKPAPLRGASRTNGSDATSVSLVSVTVDTDETDSCRVNGTSPRTPLVNGQRPQQHDNDVPTPQKLGICVLCPLCLFDVIKFDAGKRVSQQEKPMSGAHVLHFERGLRQTLIMDGSHFLVVVQKESDRLHELCAKAELYLEAEDLPEEASGRIRATIGKANLLTSKKFKQFRGLCQKNLEQADDEPFQTTAQDLAGFWDMVLTQVDDLDCKFAEIESLRSNGWISRNASSASLNNIEKSSNKAKHSGTKNKSCRQPSVACTPKSSLSASARAHRDEARRRLLQAKRAGRQRKVSQSDNKDDVEVEIFVPQ